MLNSKYYQNSYFDVKVLRIQLIVIHHHMIDVDSVNQIV